MLDEMRRPITTTNLIQHRTPDAYPRIGFKACSLGWIIVAARLQKAEHSGLNQVIRLHIGR